MLVEEEEEVLVEEEEEVLVEEEEVLVEEEEVLVEEVLVEEEEEVLVEEEALPQTGGGQVGVVSPWFVDDVSQDSNGVVVAHVLKVDVVHLRTDGLRQPLWVQVCHRGDGTCSSMSPGSMRPSAATAPPFMMEPM